MSKCLKCGADLPPVGECPACAAIASRPAAPAVPSLLDKEIQIDRRLTPERTPAVAGPGAPGGPVPTFADLARGPATPPGMMPARQAAPAPRPPAPPPEAAPAPGFPPPAPRNPTPAQRLPVPPPAQAASQAMPHAAPPPQRMPVPAPGAMPPAQRMPVPAPGAMPPAQRMPVPPQAAAAQAMAMPHAAPAPQRLPVPPPRPAAPAPQAAPLMPSPGGPAPRAVSADPDDTAPGQPHFAAPRPPAPAPQSAPRGVALPGVPAPPAFSQVAEGDPDDTAPSQPHFAAAPPPEAPTAMATAALRAELPAHTEPAHAPPLAPEPGTGSRQPPAPVHVVTFSPPGRMPPPPPPGSLLPEALTPRVPHPTVPAAPARARRDTGDVAEAHELHARPAALWRRLLSFTIDAASIVGVATLYITLASSITGVKAPPASQGLTALDSLAAWMHALKSVLLPGAALLLVLAAAYCAIAAFLWNGRTLGRLVLGLRLVDTHGVAPAPTRAILRAVLSLLSFGLFLGGFWMALFDRRGQTLHDKLTSTFVIQPS